MTDATKCPHLKKATSIKRLVSRARQIYATSTCVKVTKLSTCLELSSLSVCAYCLQINCCEDISCHYIRHSKKKNHPISINLKTLIVWCDNCEKQLVATNDTNQLVREAEKCLKQAHPDFVIPEPLIEPEKLPLAKNPGLNNLGNTCFFNAVLQCLVYTQSIDPHRFAALDFNDTPLTLSLLAIVEKMRSACNSSPRVNINPKKLFDLLGMKWPLYKGYLQQDSHELLRRLLDTMHEEHLKKDENGRIIDFKQETFLDEIFKGHLVSVIVCDQCKSISYSFEEYMDISVPIVKPSQAKSSIKRLISTIIRSPPSQRKVSMSDTSPQLKPHLDKEHSQHFESLSKDLDSMRLQRSRTGTEEKDLPLTVDTEQEIDRKISLIQSLLRPLTVYLTPGASKDIHLEQCLAHFLRLEVLKEDNAWACDNCYKLKYPEEFEQTDSKIVENQAKLLELKLPPEIQILNNIEASDSDLILNEGSNEFLQAASTCSYFSLDESDASSTSASSSISTSSIEEPKPVEEKKKKHPPVLSRAFKRYLIYSLPKVLVFHLKRFSHAGQGYKASKKNEFVKFEEYICMDSFMAPLDMPPRKQDDSPESRSGKKYRVYGVIVHTGSLLGGHYVAYVRILDNQWVYCSDTVVSATNWEAVSKVNAYMLFYEQTTE